MRRAHALPLLALLAMGGCGTSSTSSNAPPLGRAIDAAPPAIGPAPAPVGDPAAERGGTVPRGMASGENTPAAGAAASSPQGALRRYALSYTNWNAATLSAHERQLATLAIGPARLAALQTAAALGGNSELAAHRVRDTGVVLAIAPGEGPARGEWVVVTQERTSGTGAYAGLPASPHVTLARVRRVGSGWVVYEWRAVS